MIIPGWLNSKVISREIRLSTGWEELLKKKP